MPIKSRKRRLIDLLVKDFTTISSINKNECIDKEMEILLENIEMLYYSRYLVTRYKLPKSDHWSTKILPHLSDSRFRAQLRVTRDQFQLILK